MPKMNEIPEEAKNVIYSFWGLAFIQLIFLLHDITDAEGYERDTIVISHLFFISLLLLWSYLLKEGKNWARIITILAFGLFLPFSFLS